MSMRPQFRISAPEPVPLERRLPEHAWAWVADQVVAQIANWPGEQTGAQRQPGTEKAGDAPPQAPLADALSMDRVPVAEATGRVLATAVSAHGDLPPTPLAAGDGYAVVATSTAGASAYNPLPLRWREPESDEALQPDQAQPMVWGQPLPRGADAVLSLDDAEPVAAGIEVYQPVASGVQVMQAGEECRAGEELLAAGHRLRPQDLAILRLIGLERIDLVRLPRIALLLTCSTRRDGNADMLGALIRRDGGELVSVHSADGDHRRLRELLSAEGYDALLCVGGSGLGANDHAPAVLAELGDLDIRGVAIGPGDTLTLGRIGVQIGGQSVRRPVCLLPGPALACFSAYELVVGRLIRRLAGWPDAPRTDWPQATLEAILARKIASPLGSLQLCRVRLRDGLAEPLDLAGGRLLRSAVDADGFVIVPLHCEGYPQGERVLVRLF